MVAVAITHVEIIGGRTAYNIYVNQETVSWTIRKYYTDFELLDKQLQAYPNISRLPLPGRGVLGLRHFLDVGDFNKQRQEGLQAYLVHLASQLQSLSNLPCLAHFLGLAAGMSSGNATETVVHAAVPLVVAHSVTGTAASAAETPGGGSGIGSIVPLNDAGYHAVIHSRQCFRLHELGRFLHRWVVSEGGEICNEVCMENFASRHLAGATSLQTFQQVKAQLEAAADSEDWIKLGFRMPEARPATPVHRVVEAASPATQKTPAALVRSAAPTNVQSTSVVAVPCARPIAPATLGQLAMIRPSIALPATSPAAGYGQSAASLQAVRVVADPYMPSMAQPEMTLPANRHYDQNDLQRCFKCEGRGFIHASTMDFREACSECQGMGRLESANLHG